MNQPAKFSPLKLSPAALSVFQGVMADVNYRIPPNLVLSSGRDLKSEIREKLRRNDNARIRDYLILPGKDDAGHGPRFNIVEYPDTVSSLLKSGHDLQCVQSSFNVEFPLYGVCIPRYVENKDKEHAVPSYAYFAFAQARLWMACFYNRIRNQDIAWDISFNCQAFNEFFVEASKKEGVALQVAVELNLIRHGDLQPNRFYHFGYHGYAYEGDLASYWTMRLTGGLEVNETEESQSNQKAGFVDSMVEALEQRENRPLGTARLTVEPTALSKSQVLQKVKEYDHSFKDLAKYENDPKYLSTLMDCLDSSTAFFAKNVESKADIFDTIHRGLQNTRIGLVTSKDLMTAKKNVLYVIGDALTRLWIYTSTELEIDSIDRMIHAEMMRTFGRYSTLVGYVKVPTDAEKNESAEKILRECGRLVQDQIAAIPEKELPEIKGVRLKNSPPDPRDSNFLVKFGALIGDLRVFYCDIDLTFPEFTGRENIRKALIVFIEIFERNAEKPDDETRLAWAMLSMIKSLTKFRNEIKALATPDELTFLRESTALVNVTNKRLWLISTAQIYIDKITSILQDPQ